MASALFCVPALSTISIARITQSANSEAKQATETFPTRGAAHESGGHAWDAPQRQAFANELGSAHHLIAVKASANRSKGKKAPAEWLPTKEDYICEYVTSWMQIKLTWNLSISSGEAKALDTAVREHCQVDAEIGLAP